LFGAQLDQQKPPLVAAASENYISYAEHTDARDLDQNTDCSNGEANLYMQKELGGNAGILAGRIAPSVSVSQETPSSSSSSQFQAPASPLHPSPAQAQDWVEYLSPEGAPYYYNTTTQQVQWESPFLGDLEHSHHPLQDRACGGNFDPTLSVNQNYKFDGLYDTYQTGLEYHSDESLDPFPLFTHSQSNLLTRTYSQDMKSSHILLSSSNEPDQPLFDRTTSLFSEFTETDQEISAISMQTSAILTREYDGGE